MLRWISGRLGRPKASVLSMLMLVVFLLLLAPPPVLAVTESTTGVTDWSTLTEGLKSAPVPMVILDFTNRSTYRFGMLGRETANAFSLAMESTKKFTVVDRKEIDTALDEMGKTEPLDVAAQAQLANQLDYPYVVAGEIERVDIVPSKDGVFAAVTVSAIVTSQVTRLPIAGARVTKAGTPHPGYCGDPAALVLRSDFHRLLRISRAHRGLSHALLYGVARHGCEFDPTARRFHDRPAAGHAPGHDPQ